MKIYYVDENDPETQPESQNNYSSFKTDILRLHNEIRKKFNLLGLKWSPKLENYASEMAESYLKGREFREIIDVTRDQITLWFEDELPSCEEIFEKIYSENILLEKWEFQKDTGINPIYNPEGKYIGAAQKNDGENKLVAVFVYNPGRNMAIIN